MPWLAMGVTITCFTILSVFYKLSERTNCNAVSFSAWLFSAATLTSIVTYLQQADAAANGLVSPWLLLMAVASGICAVACIGCLMQALRTGSSLSVANIFLNVSILIPLVFSLLFLGQQPTLTTLLGIVCFVVFIVLLNTGHASAGETTE